MRQTRGFSLLGILAIFAGAVLATCAAILIWKLFLRTPAITFMPNTRGLTMMQIIKAAGEHVDENELTFAQLEKMHKAYARTVKIDGPMNKLEKYRGDHRSDGVWQIGSSVINCYIFTDNVVPSAEYYRKYIR